MALSPIEDSYLQRLTSSQFPDMPASEPAMPVDAAALDAPSMDGMQLAAGPSPVVSDAGAAFGVYPGMGKRSQRSDIGERMVTGAPDFAAGAARGATTAALGLGGDIQNLGRFIAALATDDQGGGIMDKLGRAAQTMSLPTFLPTSENLSKGGYTIPGTSITLPGLPSAVPAGQGGFGMTPEQRQSAADVGQLAGELVGDPVMFAKAGQVAAKAVKATKGMPVGMSTQAVGGMDGVLTPTAKAAAPVNDMGFYSAVEQAALNIQRKSGTGQAMLNDITKGQDVKLDEVKWIGLDDFLKGKKNVTKEEVQQYIAANKVDVQEVQLGGDFKPITDPQEAINYLAKEKGLTPEQLVDEYGYIDPNDYVDLANDVAQPAEAKFGAYTLPGGENYREILLTMPGRSEREIADANMQAFTDRVTKRIGRTGWDFDSMTPDELAEYERLNQNAMKASTETPKGYKSSHWEQPNVLAHIRVNDRVDADGKKMLLVEEVQSDWHQAGRDKGYKTNETAELPQGTKVFAPGAPDSPGQTNMAYTVQIPRNVNGRSLFYGTTEEEAIANARSFIAQPSQSAVPDAPMKDTWYQMALKRVLKYAADNGYERIGLTTGKTNAERFDLSKQVDEIAVPTVNSDGTRSVRIDPIEGSSIKLMIDADGVVKGYGPSSNQFTGKKLNEVVGKEMAEKIMAADKETKFTGLDLSVGGEGMKKYYDEVYPQFLSKYGKKWGAKVGETKINLQGDLEGFMPRKDMQVEPVRYIDITPEMRQGVGKGQPLFTATGIGAGTTGATMQDKEQK